MTINGIVKASSLEEVGSGKTNRDKATWIIYINVNSISSHVNNDKNNNKNNTNNNTSINTTLDNSSNRRSSTCNNTSMSANELEFSKDDLEFFQTLTNTQYPFKIIVNSLCPSIFGHEFVKAGLVLGLFGGSKKSEANDVAVRSDVHVLVVGDPGLGKVFYFIFYKKLQIFVHTLH